MSELKNMSSVFCFFTLFLSFSLRKEGIFKGIFFGLFNCRWENKQSTYYYSLQRVTHTQSNGLFTHLSLSLSLNIYIYIYIYACVCVFVWVLWPINHCRLFNAKSIFIQKKKSRQDWTWERWRGTPHSSKFQHHWNLIIRLFNDIIWTLVVGASYPSAEVQSVFSPASAEWARRTDTEKSMNIHLYNNI